jgi:hypothetical protein
MKQLTGKLPAIGSALILVLLTASNCYADGLSGLGEGYAIMAVLGLLQLALVPLAIGYYFRRTDNERVRMVSSIVLLLLFLFSSGLSGMLFFPRYALSPLVFVPPFISLSLILHRMAARARSAAAFTVLYGIRSLFLITVLYTCLWLVIENFTVAMLFASLFLEHIVFFFLLTYMVRGYLRALARHGHPAPAFKNVAAYALMLAFAGFKCCRLVLHFDHYIMDNGYLDTYQLIIHGIPFYMIGALLLIISGVLAAFIARKSGPANSGQCNSDPDQ